MRIIAVCAAAFLLASPAGAWVTDEECETELLKVRGAYREEYGRAVKPIRDRAIQSLESHLKTAQMRRDTRTIDLIRNVRRRLELDAGVFGETLRSMAIGKVPREIELLCANYENETARVLAGMTKRALAELDRVGKDLKAAGRDGQLAVLARERQGLENGDYAAWGAASMLARRLEGYAWQFGVFSLTSVRFFADGSIGGTAEGTWKQVGDHTVRARFKPTDARSPAGVRTTYFWADKDLQLTFSTDFMSVGGKFIDPLLNMTVAGRRQQAVSP